MVGWFGIKTEWVSRVYSEGNLHKDCKQGKGKRRLNYIFKEDVGRHWCYKGGLYMQKVLYFEVKEEKKRVLGGCKMTNPDNWEILVRHADHGSGADSTIDNMQACHMCECRVITSTQGAYMEGSLPYQLLQGWLRLKTSHILLGCLPHGFLVLTSWLPASQEKKDLPLLKVVILGEYSINQCAFPHKRHAEEASQKRVGLALDKDFWDMTSAA